MSQPGPDGWKSHKNTLLLKIITVKSGPVPEQSGGQSVFGVRIRVSIVDSSTVKDMACFGQMIHQIITASILCGQHHSRKQKAQLWSPEIHGYKYICVYIKTGTSKKKMNIMKTVTDGLQIMKTPNSVSQKI